MKYYCLVISLVLMINIPIKAQQYQKPNYSGAPQTYNNDNPYSDVDDDQIQFDENTGTAYCEQIIYSDHSKAVLFERSSKWATYTFRYPDKAIRGFVKDEYLKGSGYVVNMAEFPVFMSTQKEKEVLFDWEIRIKEGKVKVKLYNIRIRFYSISDGEESTWPLRSFLYKYNGEERTHSNVEEQRKNFSKAINQYFEEIKKYLKGSLPKYDW